MQDIILNLIKSKREGDYWDFKKEPHTNNSDLIHDIICMANSLHRGNKYIIIGVSDPHFDCEIIGLVGQRKTQANYIDLIRTIDFAADNRPAIEVHTISIENKDIDIITVLDSNNKPYYLNSDFMGLKKSFIYTRIGDTNTPKDQSADYYIIEKMWRNHFGLDLVPSERFKTIIKDKENWDIDVGNKEIAYYRPSPEYQILFEETHEGWEIYSYFYANEKSFFGRAIFKYLSTPLFELPFAFVDEYRIPIATPDISSFSIVNHLFYYYYIIDSLKYSLMDLLGLQSIFMMHNKEYVPFIFFSSIDEKAEFETHLKEIENINEIILKDENGKHISERMKKNGFDHGGAPYFISFVIKEYYKWKGTI